ncbi:MAG: GGDEF domain-containing protein [Planctomycetaceae bacterium]|nr:GGDEF domain-containing protein [Planctomycetaceae bacterium]
MLDAKKIWSSSTLPTLPAVAVKLLDLSRDPETETGDIVKLIKTDPAICAKILQATNSSYFGFSARVTSIDRAVPLLGTTVVTSLALSFSLASDSVNSGPLQDHYRSYWKQSIIHAVAGETIGKRCTRGLECEYFLAGLMMDIGRLAMLKTVSREYYPVVVTAEAQQRPLHEVEREFLGLDHAEVSFQLMKSWGLPESLMSGVRRQHYTMEELLQDLQPGVHTLEAAMVLANAVGDYFISPACGVAWKRIQRVGQHFFDMNENELEAFLGQVRERVAQAGELFAVDMSDVGDPSDLMAQANQQLLELTMRAHVENTQITARQKQMEEEKERLQSQNQELQEKVTRDPLTGVSNRAHFDAELQQTIDECQDRCQPCGVIFTDIDKFKVLNDTYGHQFGDAVLKRFAGVLAKNLRSSDLLARYGGEEFVILVNRPTEKGVEKVAERIRQAVEDEIIEFQGQRVPVTASFGAAIAIPGRRQHNNAETILQQADAAMYDSKHGGRNRVTMRCLFSDEERALLRAINQVKFSRWLVNQEILDIPGVSRALLQVVPDPRALGHIAQEVGLLTPQDVDSILQTQAQASEKPFGEIALEQALLTYDQLAYLLAWQTEPPQKLAASLCSCGLFPEVRSQQLLGRYLETCPLREAHTVQAK